MARDLSLGSSVPEDRWGEAVASGQSREFICNCTWTWHEHLDLNEPGGPSSSTPGPPAASAQTLRWGHTWYYLTPLPRGHSSTGTGCAEGTVMTTANLSSLEGTMLWQAA